MILRDIIIIGAHSQAHEPVALGFLKDDIIEGMDTLTLRISPAQDAAFSDVVIAFNKVRQLVGGLFL